MTGENKPEAVAAPGGLPRESVWDYPRPPRLEAVPHRLQVIFGGIVLADSMRGLRMLETSHPPTYYIPMSDIRMDLLSACQGTSLCEFKGRAEYFNVSAAGLQAAKAAWTYPNPTPAYSGLAGTVAFYPSKMESCWVGEEQVLSQAGDFYGGWITPNLVGPFKGGPGTLGWRGNGSAISDRCQSADISLRRDAP